MIGSAVDLEITDVAFGGEFVARHEAELVFVRGTILGEKVRARITHKRKRGYLATVEEILRPSPARIEHPWPLGSVAQTGAANYGHIELTAQRAMKAHMLRRELKLAGLTSGLGGASPEMFTVDPVPEADPAAPGWRYRTRIWVDKLATGVGMYVPNLGKHVPLTEIPLASRRLEALQVCGNAWDALATTTEPFHVQLVAPSASPPLLLANGQAFSAPGQPAAPVVREVVEFQGEKFWYELAADGFWQVHEYAPALLVASVFDAVSVTPGDTLVDLYSGAGLFSQVAAELVGPAGKVRAYEGNELATRAARKNLAAYPWAEAYALTLDAQTIAEIVPGADIVIADPPRAGLGAQAATELARSSATQIVLVSCDARSMARDVTAILQAGRQLTYAHALDIFPNTHFVETVCAFV
ncbi:tRNA/tmRNA/rRNA uracil-C5-methylase, TrmA/RlmC/RlmD family [Actinobaculum suis]|uniref:Class I SAM-dependent RNA methyltransferase n=1 Tax=Actinobaculum suis TaxID=1657 RepID=A0A1G7CWK8_9ACTO|nr:TRAM domain-containing protein [Actinobaculum suis]MDY5152759.1 class I SAM-dependent RNA methyltransferase [Actinobaculum suis]SDE43689.1 tRNA/tmRNA/rRNA uracil-C5-methylase, TrmA/RlmC/RlmD family [Actinobaculum suis]